MLQDGADSPILSFVAHHGDSAGAESINIPRNVSHLRFSAASHDGASAEATGGFSRGPGCLGTDEAVDGAASATFGTFFGVHPQGCPNSQHLFMGI